MEQHRSWLAALLASAVAAASLAGGCARPPTPSPMPPTQVDVPQAFPLVPGTTWTYDYMSYEAGLGSDVITATYSVTETVVTLAHSFGYVLAGVSQEHRIFTAPPEWHSSDSEFAPTWWYVLRGSDIYELREKPNLSLFDPRTSPLLYRLPLAVGATWCPLRIDVKDPGRGTLADCEAAGKRTVVERRALDTRIGRLETCYRITQSYNSGGDVDWLCDGVGLVDRRYDHGGSPFGFHKELVGFRLGAPTADGGGAEP